MTVHPVAARGFADSEVYDRARPGYPAAAVEWLRTNLQLSPSTKVVDVAAGTGKLTGHLTGSRVMAVEPLSSMARQLRRNHPQVPVVAAVAEALPIRTAGVDAITVAQAFHWFDARRAFAEFYRVLRPGGRVGLIWNARDRSVEWVDRLWRIMDRVEKTAPWRDHDRQPDRGLAEAAGFGDVHRAGFYHTHVLDRTRLVERFSSVSHVAVLDDHERRAVIEDVLRVVDSHPATRGRKELAIPYRVDAYWMERLG